MSIFHLMHCVPYAARMHGMHGYKETIETIDWGLKQLGHQVGYALNKASTQAINIVFGAQVLPIATLEKLPANTIIYNFEQIRGLQKHQLRHEMQFFAERFQIWEYSQGNLETWKSMGYNHVKHVPVGYAPVLSRIPKFSVQDIDVFIFGLTGDKRLNAFHKLSQAGIKTVFVSGLYGDARDNLIARSKIVLNVNLYDYARIFEIVRVSYLLANKKAVVAILDLNTEVEQGIKDVVKFSSLDTLVEDCIMLLTQDMEREQFENKGFEYFSRRDIRPILQNALSN